MDWNTYYEKFYDWATSTQISRMSSLTSFGASSEVAEVAQEYMDEKAASRLIKKRLPMASSLHQMKSTIFPAAAIHLL